MIEHAATVKFFAPDAAYADGRKHLPARLIKRGISSSAAISVLDGLESIVQPIDFELYAGQQQQALQRIAIRDADDWPVLACAMTIGCPGLDRRRRFLRHRRSHLDNGPCRVVLGRLKHRLNDVLFTPRAHRVHVISLRKANQREVNDYEQKTKS